MTYSFENLAEFSEKEKLERFFEQYKVCEPDADRTGCFRSTPQRRKETIYPLRIRSISRSSNSISFPIR
jgi:hypothetical protein